MRTKHLLTAACVAALATAAFAQDGHRPAEAAKPATMQRMQEQMKQIQAATDPKERQRLVDEHMKTMQEAMPMRSGMKDMQQGCMGMMQQQ